MRLQPGSLPWLIAHDLTLNWRRFIEMFARLSPRAMWAVLVAGAIALHLVAWPVAAWLVRLLHESSATSTSAAAVLVLSVFAWMIAQGLLGTSRTLQERGSSDLLFSSPLPVRLVLASRAAATAASSFGSVGLLVLPVANVGVLLDGPSWLAAYPALFALSLIGTTAGLAAAIGLFLVLDARRARAYAQLCAALVGGAFLLGAQIAAMLPEGMRTAIADRIAGSKAAVASRRGAARMALRHCGARLRGLRDAPERELPVGEPARCRRRRRHASPTVGAASFLAVRVWPGTHAAPQGVAPAVPRPQHFRAAVAADHLHGAARGGADAWRRQHSAGACDRPGHRRHRRADCRLAGLDHRVGRGRAGADCGRAGAARARGARQGHGDRGAGARDPGDPPCRARASLAVRGADGGAVCRRRQHIDRAAQPLAPDAGQPARHAAPSLAIEAHGAARAPDGHAVGDRDRSRRCRLGLGAGAHRAGERRALLLQPAATQAVARWAGSPRRQAVTRCCIHAGCPSSRKRSAAGSGAC